MSKSFDLRAYLLAFGFFYGLKSLALLHLRYYFLALGGLFLALALTGSAKRQDFVQQLRRTFAMLLPLMVGDLLWDGQQLNLFVLIAAGLMLASHFMAVGKRSLADKITDLVWEALNYGLVAASLLVLLSPVIKLSFARELFNQKHIYLLAYVYLGFLGQLAGGRFFRLFNFLAIYPLLLIGFDYGNYYDQGLALSELQQFILLFYGLALLINGLLLFKYFISYRAIFLLLALAIFVSPLFFNLEHLDDEMRRSSFVFNGLAKPFTMRLSSNYELIFQPSGQGEREFIEANLTLILYREGVVPDQPLDAAQQEALREKLLAQAIGSRMFLFQKLQLLWDERKGYRLGTYQLAAILEKKFIAPSDGAEAPAAAGDEEVISED